MNDAAGLVSTVALIIFVLALLFLGVLFFVRPGILDETESEAVLGDDTYDSNLEEKLEDATKFLYDVAARNNEGLVQNIDAIDNALIAIAVGIIAAALFAGDKFADLQAGERIAAFFVLGAAAVATIVGYLLRTPELGELETFAIDFAELRQTATQVAIEGLIAGSEVSRQVRGAKKVCVIVAIALVAVAGILIIIGRAHGSGG